MLRNRIIYGVIVLLALTCSYTAGHAACTRDCNIMAAGSDYYLVGGSANVCWTWSEDYAGPYTQGMWAPTPTGGTFAQLTKQIIRDNYTGCSTQCPGQPTNALANPGVYLDASTNAKSTCLPKNTNPTP